MNAREKPMPTKPQEGHAADSEKQARRQLPAIIREKVIDVLGRPAGFHLIQVRKLWDDRYRVNVMTGADLSSAVVAHSFFVVSDDDGNIVASTPGITKQY
jgi:hypothetical protein